MSVSRPSDLVEETIVVAGEPIELVRPRDSDELLEEEAFEHEQLLPYCAELWPSSVAPAKAVGARALRRARTLEPGCGLGPATSAAPRARPPGRAARARRARAGALARPCPAA